MLRSFVKRGIITLTKHPQELDNTAAACGFHAAGAPVVTSAMIEAGVYAAREHCLGEGLEDLVRKVYVAMALEDSN
jgi:hypothetical protein